MGKRYKEWKNSFEMKKKYSKNHPYCSYDFIERFLPEDKNTLMMDVGCGGRCLFENYFNLWDKYENILLLDGNKETVHNLRLDCRHSIYYRAPNVIPFDDKIVDFIYCSHLIEHLYPLELHKLLVEFNRVLKPGGIMVIRSPIFHFEFYNTIDHIKTYPPAVLSYFLCGDDTLDSSYEIISRDYEVVDLIYRYHTHLPDYNRMGSSNKIIDFIIQGAGRISRKLGIKRYKQSGYTMVLRKGE